jgi:hypothetical protein
MRRVWVCTADRVLAKRVRFLLARDDHRVEIASDPGALDDALSTEGCDLLVVSHELDGLPALERLPTAVREDRGPPTLVLGGSQDDGAGAHVRFVEDPSDSRAIVAAATELLAVAGYGPPAEEQTEQTMKIDAPAPADRPAEANEATESGPVDPAALARRFYTCAARGLTGRLEIESGAETLTFHLLEGRPVHVTSSVPGDRFGRWLVEGERITDAAYSTAAQYIVENGVGLGPALVATGAMSEGELAQHRADHARTLIVDRFGSTEATFRFTEGTPPAEQTFDLDVLPVVAEGFKRHADDDLVETIMGDKAKGYFKVRTDADHLGETFHLDRQEVELLRFEGRAYNPPDAAELSGLPFRDALKLLALLWTCDEVEDFTPGVSDFEARIDEEKERARESRSMDIMRSAPSLEDEPAPLPFGAPMVADDEAPSDAFSFGDEEPGEEIEPFAAVEEEAPISRPPPPPPEATPLPIEAIAEEEEARGPESSGPRPAPPPGVDVPPMPVPGPGHDGAAPAPLLWAAPAPRSPDGSLVETPERAQSREFFQQGVQLLGQGQFEAAEQSFREAISLCSDEPVYLIGLGRAIFYNATYTADGKVPVLRSIVDRAERLSPNDGRVMDLRTWVEHAQPTPV